jgi:Methyltransferase domain
LTDLFGIKGENVKEILENIRKTPLRNMYRWTRMITRNPVFRRTMKDIVDNPQQALNNRDILTRLAYGWGNESHSASIEYLEDCIKYASQSGLPILECGSGLTSIIAGLVAMKNGNTVWTLENIKSWYQRVKKYLDMYNIASVRHNYCPIKDYGDFAWYNAPLDVMPDKFSLVICDGPAIKNVKLNVFPAMKDRFSPGCIILFDDARVGQLDSMISYWAEKIGMSYELRGKTNPYYVMRVK